MCIQQRGRFKIVNNKNGFDFSFSHSSGNIDSSVLTTFPTTIQYTEDTSSISTSNSFEAAASQVTSSNDSSNGLSNVTAPSHGVTALVEEISLHCSDWQDPEGSIIAKYSYYGQSHKFTYLG